MKFFIIYIFILVGLIVLLLWARIHKDRRKAKFMNSVINMDPTQGLQKDIQALHERITELESENAKLREQLSKQDQE